ncbi:MAG: DNA/RNA non-specific endonuclease [Bdellovibrionia bacterium]
MKLFRIRLLAFIFTFTLLLPYQAFPVPPADLSNEFPSANSGTQLTNSGAREKTFSPHFPYPLGKSRIDPDSKPSYAPDQKNIRYLDYRGYYSVYDVNVNTPLLTIEHLGQDHEAIQPDLQNPVSNNSTPAAKLSRPRNQKFRSDCRLTALERIEHNSYEDVTKTFSRGHLTPCGDFDERSLKVQTFMTTNVAPQVQNSFNDGLWNDLETQVRTLSDQPKKDFTVITGVVHDDQARALKLNGKISIPTHFYKIVINDSFPLKPSAFLMQNRHYFSNEMNLCDYIVPVEKIEKLTGMNFLISLPENKRQESINNVGTFEGLCP